jgi:hypothetical protein
MSEISIKRSRIIIAILTVLILIIAPYSFYKISNLKDIIENENIIQENMLVIEEKESIIEEKNKTIQEQREEIKKTEELKQDKDNDGWTLRQELIAGTSDENPDTDGDGIIDSKDRNPLGGGRYIAKNFEFNYNFTEYEIRLDIHSDWYDYYRELQRTIVFKSYITDKDPTMIKLIKEIEKVSRKMGYCTECAILSFVHSLDYTEDERTGFDDYRKYPIETLVEGNGDCEDTAFLMATLFKMKGYDTALVFFEDLHMGVGIACDDCNGSYYIFPDEDIKYYYIEPTNRLNWGVGELPNILSGLKPELFKI